MKTLIKKAGNANFLKVAALSVFGMGNIKAEMSQELVAGITIGILFLGFLVAFLWGRMGAENEG